MNNSGNWSKASFLHLAICMGCTLNCDPSWLSVLLPRIASNATRALNFALYCFLVIVDFSLVNDSVENLNLFLGPKSWDHYTPRATSCSTLDSVSNATTGWF